MNSSHPSFNPRSIALIAVFSFLFALSWTLPSFASGTSLGICIALALLIMIPIAALTYAAMRANDKLVVSPSPTEASKLDKMHNAILKPLKGRTAFASPLFIGMLVALILLWSFFLLTLYPGIASTDSVDVMKMALGLPFESDHFRYDSLNNHHPAFYVLMNWGALNLGALLGLGEIGQVACAASLHMLVLAICCSWATAKLAGMYRSKGLTVFLLLFFLCNPLIALYSISIWKDVVFAALFLVV